MKGTTEREQLFLVEKKCLFWSLTISNHIIRKSVFFLLHKQARKVIFKLIFQRDYSAFSRDKIDIISVTLIILRKKAFFCHFNMNVYALKDRTACIELQNLVANAVELKMLHSEEMRQNQSDYKFIHNLPLLLNILYCEEMHFLRDSSK